MELKVWVEGIQRIVCGVTINTTCQDVVFALAHATGKVGRFTLIERWRNNERLLAPNENPLKILSKWGEYSSDVQFILQRSDQIKDLDKQTTRNNISDKNNHNNECKDKTILSTDLMGLDATREFRKSLGITAELKYVDNVGIVKGVPQKPTTLASPRKLKIECSTFDPSTPSSEANVNYKINEFNTSDIRNSLDRKTSTDTSESQNFSSESLLDVFNANKLNSKDIYKNAPAISSNGALVPPPYRDPPPPRTSPLHKIDNFHKNFDFKDSVNMTSYTNMNDVSDLNENFFQQVKYKDLVQLIKFQREKISSQQADMKQYDAEIVYLENKERDHEQQINALAREISKADQIFHQSKEQLQTLQYVEEENELVRQQEKTLKSEITLLRSKLANCETELLQCKNKIRLLLDDIQIEQRALNSRQKDNRHQMEKNFMTEVERIQTEIDQAIANSEANNKTSDNLKKDVCLIENAIAEKKRQVEQLVNEMKEVNLQSLTVTPSDEIRNLLEGSNKTGSSRRIIGSPRQLENAVPTSKNPHGVWV